MKTTINEFIGKTLDAYEQTLKPNPYVKHEIRDYNYKYYNWESAKDFIIVDMAQYRDEYDHSCESDTKIEIIVDAEGMQGYAKKIQDKLVKAETATCTAHEELAKVRELFQEYYWKFGELHEGDFDIIFGCKTVKVR